MTNHSNMYKEIDSRYTSFLLENRLTEKEKDVLADFLKLYKNLDEGPQIRLTEILGKLIKEDKKSSGRTYPKWFPWQEIGYPLVDHCKRYRINGKDSVVSHPYSVTKGALDEMSKTCDKHNIDYYIDGRSNYFLGVTPRIIFTRNETL